MDSIGGGGSRSDESLQWKSLTYLPMAILMQLSAFHISS
jgi:hypothetical protein